jgi:hypothetical protein
VTAADDDNIELFHTVSLGRHAPAVKTFHVEHHLPMQKRLKIESSTFSIPLRPVT